VMAGASRWSCCSSEGNGTTGTPAARVGSGDCREGAWVVVWRYGVLARGHDIGFYNLGFNAMVRRPTLACVRAEDLRRTAGQHGGEYGAVRALRRRARVPR
jgi:hypothetical protein